ncbi:MAG: DUF1926 domain-containing protein [Myxococcales bacterium]|nr:DUF1926 domain-containing protein [Myxococcales bacterium]
MSSSAQTRLVFALHFHQPYGNLDEVFADAMDRCYLPTVEILGAYPSIRSAIHVSGPLLDWAEAHRPTMLDALRKLVARGQVEVLGGGYQEPMLAILPDRDAIGQLTLMADRCEELLGARPQGMWLAERVWEPDLPRPIAAAGYRYTLLDDSHLYAAGASAPLGDYYVADKAGRSIAVFPIDRGLRTRIPYAEVDDLLAYLESQPGRTCTYGDDTEKFGLWPTTAKRVWQEKWLARFFDALVAAEGWLATVTPTEVLASVPSSGAIYIPTISYQEMGSWALPAEASTRYQDVARRMELSGFGRDVQTFLRGGIWQAFLAKYPESNLIYRKMLRVSDEVAAAEERGDPRAAEARAALYQGQCNCAYWHGLFGGLYLQHLRAALMTALLEAEDIAAPKTGVSLEQRDHDGDLRDELLFESPALNLYVSPARGGSGIELDLRRARYHLTGVIGRRRESYHEDVPRSQVISDEDLGNISAHDLVRATEEGLERYLVVDGYPRGAFVDHLLPAESGPEIMDAAYAPLAPFATLAYEVVEATSDASRAKATLKAESGSFALEKTFVVTAEGLEVRYRLASRVPVKLRFATSLDVTLLSPAAVGGRRIGLLTGGKPAVASTVPGERATAEGVDVLTIACDDLGVAVRLEALDPCEAWRLPIETVSQSERGFERAYQGTSLVMSWVVEVGPDRPFTTSLALHVGGEQKA